jgi:hypothetical protein
MIFSVSSVMLDWFWNEERKYKNGRIKKGRMYLTRIIIIWDLVSLKNKCHKPIRQGWDKVYFKMEISFNNRKKILKPKIFLKN